MPERETEPAVTRSGVRSSGFALGSVVSERFRIEGRRAQGELSEQYLAYDLELMEPVILERRLELDDRTCREELLRQLRLARRVSSRYVCRIHDLGTAPASPQCTESQFVSLESLPGESLSARLCRGPLSPAELLLVAQHLAEALRAFHEQGLAHGAVEAENVWLREAEGAFEAVLCSFQTAREVAEEPTAGRTSSPTSGPRLQRDYASDASPQARALFASDVAALGRLLRRLTPSSGTPYSPGGAVVKGPSAEVPGSGEHAPCFELAWQALLDECERAPRALPRRGAERALWRAHELERVHRGLLFAARPGAALAEPVRRDAHG